MTNSIDCLKMKKPLYKLLYIQVLVAVGLGVLLGAVKPDVAIAMKPLGDGFINLIKMLIGPIIFCTVVSGIAGMQDMKKMGRVGAKALIYFEVISTLALFIGLIVANIVQPGVDFPKNTIQADVKTATTIGKFIEQGKEQSTVDFLLNIIPKTLIDAFAKGDILQILLIAILSGVVLAKIGKPAQSLMNGIDTVSRVLFGMVGLVMKLAPIGAFGAMAFTIGKHGLDALLPLMKLMGSFYLTAALFVFIVLGCVAKLIGFSIFRFIRYIKEELLLVLGTSSSESALPSLMNKLERMGCSKSVVGLVVPTGYSFNLDGTNIYMTMAALFIAQVYNIDLSLTQQLTLLGVAMLTSKGASGITGAGFITLAATLQVVPSIPVTGIVFIYGIDRFMSECRALTNLIGNGVATVVVAKWEGELDNTQLHAALSSALSSDLSADMDNQH